MKIQIALSSGPEATEEKKDDAKDETTVTPPSGGVGTNYSDWMKRMEGSKNFGKIKRLDGNKMVAYDTGNNIIETFTMPTDERGNMKVDTLDSEQTNAPIDKTGNDPKIDSKVEKGA